MRILFPEKDAIAEKSARQFTMILDDEAGAPVPSVAIVSIVATLKELVSDFIINSRDGQSIHNVNGGTFGATDGLLTLTLSDNDNIIVSTAQAATADQGRFQKHRLLIEAVYDTGSGNRSQRQEIDFFVEDLKWVS